MTTWFHHAIVETGRLPIFVFLVAFVLTFLFIRMSVRMIRAQVRWWPGNVSTGGVHLHHEFFGMIVMALSGFGLVAISPFQAPIGNVILAALFGIGTALVLDEFALILHLRDVYWEKEGRASIDAVFVAIAIGVLFLIGLRPFGLPVAISEFADAADADEQVGVLLAIAINVILAVITLIKGKVWTGLIGMFFPVLLLVGSIRLARPSSPWARWRYRGREKKYTKALVRETRFREPLIRWKIVAQEALAGRFGVPDRPPVISPTPDSPAASSRRMAPDSIASALRWRRTRRDLRVVPIWRLPVVLVTLAIVGALLCIAFDQSLGYIADSATLATVLGVIAGAMATLTGLVFTAVTLAMQFGAEQISVRVIPRLQGEPVMRWSIGFFLATFVFSVMIAMDLALSGPEDSTPGVSTAIAALLTILSAFLFVALVSTVGSVLNSARLMRWIAVDGRGAIRREYPEPDDGADEPDEVSAQGDGAEGDVAEGDGVAEPPLRTVYTLGEAATKGRVLLAVNIPRLQRLAVAWDAHVELLMAVGDYVPHDVAVIAIVGPDPACFAEPKVMRCLLFGDTHQPSVSPAAALQSISDIALKAISTAGNDPSTVVLALNHTEDLLLMLAPRVRADVVARRATRVSGHRRTWADYVAIGTDEIRRGGRGQAQVYRRLRSLYETLAAAVPADQQEPLRARLAALDEQIVEDWQVPLDRRLSAAPDRQGYGAELGSLSCRQW